MVGQRGEGEEGGGRGRGERLQNRKVRGVGGEKWEKESGEEFRNEVEDEKVGSVWGKRQG